MNCFRIFELTFLGLLCASIFSACDELPLQESSEKIQTTPVLVSVKLISPGEELSSLNLRVANWPMEYIPEGALSHFGEVQGRVALGPIPSNVAIAHSVTASPISPLHMTTRAQPLTEIR